MKAKSANGDHIQFRHSLQARLLLILVLIAFIPLVSMQVLSTVQAANMMGNETEKGFTNVANNETQYITDWSAERMQDIKTLAAMSEIKTFDKVNGQKILDETKASWGVFESIVAFDKKGITVLNTDHKVIDASQRQYFIDALAGKDTISEPLISKGTGHVVIFFAVPLVSSGETIGVMAGNVNFDVIGSMLSKTNLGKTGEAYLINKGGLMVTPPKYEDYLKSTGAVKDTALLQYKVDTYAGQQIQAGKSGISRYNDYRGKPVVGTYTWIDSIHLGLILEEEQSELLAPVNQFRNLSIGLVAAVLLILGVVIFLVTRSISSPIKQMAQLADKLSEGNTQIQVALGRKDELGMLANSFQRIITSETAMANAAQRISDGDLTVDFQTRSEKDELGQAFAQMASRLRSLVTQVVENAIALSSASGQLTSSAQQSGQAAGQIAGTIQEITKGIGQQSESVTHTASTVEQMSRSIDGVAKGAQEQAVAVSKTSEFTNQLSSVIQEVSASAEIQAKGAAESVTLANKSSKTVEETIQGMQRIQAKVNLTAQKVQEMGQRSDQIVMIVETIDDIASQTNLLALNAAIEAARAGEHGKGFAVVADEVRKLAEKSAGATKEIASLVKGIQATVSEAVQAMKESALEVEGGVVLANQSGQALGSILDAAVGGQKSGETIAAAAVRMSSLANELVDAMDGVSAVVEQNTAAMEEMAAGSGEVTRAIENIASVSEENSAATEEVSAAAEEMSAQVEEVTASAQTLTDMAQALQELVSQFKLNREEKSLKHPAVSVKPANGNGQHLVLARNNGHPVRTLN
jgi:methyl-accepting chemotaxis protein